MIPSLSSARETHVCNLEFEKAGWDVSFSVETGERIYHFCIEIKPEIGEDYPAVLRQIQSYPAGVQYRGVVVRRFTAKSVPIETVQAIFAHAGIFFLSENGENIKYA